MEAIIAPETPVKRDLEVMAEKYISTPGIAADLGIPLLKAHTLTRRRDFPEAHRLFGESGTWVFERSAYLRFKEENPDVIRDWVEKHSLKKAG